MSKGKTTPMTPARARAIASTTARSNGGKIPARSLASRADAAVQRKAANSGGGDTQQR